MKTSGVLVAAVLLGPAFVLGACEDAGPLEPDGVAIPLGARANGRVDLPGLPFHGTTAGQLLTMEIAPPGRCPPDLPMLFSYRGEGNATHMGRFTVEGGECAFFDPDDPGSARSGSGEWTFTAANGDELSVGYDEAVVTLEGPTSPWILFYVPSLEATGGTGRFAAAELVDVTWRGGVHLGTFETYSELDGRIAFR
jgi:hypothetical protein